MSNEKLRRETARADITIIRNEDKVTNAQITMTDVGSQPSTRYFGFKMYPITVTFTVPAANL